MADSACLFPSTATFHQSLAEQYTMAPNPDSSWNTLFSNLSSQGAQFNDPISPSSTYFAFLSTGDQDERTGLWTLLFELLPAEWVYNVYPQDPTIRTLPPADAPYTLFQIVDAKTEDVLSTLNVKSADYVADGSWYRLLLSKNSFPLFGNILNRDYDRLTPEGPYKPLET